jgi:hypothetical protein
VNKLRYFLSGQVESCSQLLNYLRLFKRGEGQLVVTGHDTSQALNVIAHKRNDMNAINGLASIAAAFIAAATAMTFNNPHTTFITGRDFQRWHRATVHEVLIQSIISQASAFVVVALVKTFWT